MSDPRMENYNYYRDSRVQMAMFSPCWNLDESGESQAVISFEDDWVAEQLEDEASIELGESWADEGQDRANAYRVARDWSADLKGDRDRLKAAARSSEGVEYDWQLSKEITAELSARHTIIRDAENVEYKERVKLYELAAAEIDKAALLKEKGLMPDGRIKVQVKYEVCGMCRGSGKTTNPNIDCGGISRDDFHDDPDFEEDYFSGRYDITCTQCKGVRVESMPVFPEWLLKWIEDRDQSQMDGIREQCAELAMGA